MNNDKQSKKTIHMIGNAHLDPVWLWAQNEGKLSSIQTAGSAVDRMKETPEFVFSCSSASMYKWIEEENPDLFKEIRKYIKSGQWEIVGGWWVQPDCNVPSGESFIRQGFYGKSYFRKKFGVDVKVGYNVDSFGHNGGIPQILKQQGLDYYIFFRPPLEDMNIKYGQFRWQSPDGSQVIAIHPPHHYNTGAFPHDDIDLNPRIPDSVKGQPDFLNDILCFYGVGNHGGGPTKKHIKTIQDYKDPDGKISAVFSSLHKYFEIIKPLSDKFPIEARELQFHARGCYSVHSGIKKWNRKAENILLSAEKLASVSSLYNNRSYPEKLLSELWETVLFNQFHDILAGTSIRVVYLDAEKEFESLFSRAGRKLSGLMSSMLQGENSGRNFLMFNPSAVARTEVVQIKAGSFLRDSAVTSGGEPVEIQISGGKTYAQATLPSMGFQVIKQGSKKPEKSSDEKISVTEKSLENCFLKLDIDPDTGFMKNLFDKKNNMNVFTGPADIPAIYNDESDTWGHDTDKFDDLDRNAELVKTKITEEGSLFAGITVDWKYNKSKIRQVVRMYRDLPYIDLYTTVVWHEKHKLLKFNFPVNVKNGISTYEMPYSTSVRDTDGTEMPMQQWFDLTGQNVGSTYGLSILNDCKYSGSVDKNVMNLTILRSPGFAHHVPDTGIRVAQNEFIDQGIQTFTIRLVPHSGSWEENNIPGQAEALNTPVIIKKVSQSECSVPAGQPVISVFPETLQVTAFKAAENGSGYILRIFESSGKKCSGKICILNVLPETEITFRKHEIKTMKLYRDSKGKYSFTQVNAMEE